MAALSPTFRVALKRVKVWELPDLCKWCWKGEFSSETGFSHLGLRLILCLTSWKVCARGTLLTSMLNLLEAVCPGSFAYFGL